MMGSSDEPCGADLNDSTGAVTLPINPVNTQAPINDPQRLRNIIQP
jgi:hypothetical protein